MTVQQGKYYGLLITKLLVSVMLFLLAVQFMVLSFKLLNADLVEQIIIATSNPFVSLFIGILITALVQSSSTTTTVIVAIVASGTISLENGVFMVMGANIGTTITSTLVSLGHITRKKEFRKAISAATLHDFFNISTALILLPLEYYLGILSNLARWISSFFATGTSLPADYGLATRESLLGKTGGLSEFVRNYDILCVIASILLLFLSLRLISSTFRVLLLEKYPSRLERYLFSNSGQSLLLGAFLTGLVQSSSLVTSLIVPIVANNRLSLKKAFPFLMGANVGTTLTALIAAIPESEAALSIAFAHLLFNIIGVLVFFPFKVLRHIPINMARNLGKITLKNRLYGFAYLIVTFFVVPFFLIFFSQGETRISSYTYVEEAGMNFPFSYGYKSASGTKPQTVRLLYKRENVNEENIYTPDQTSTLNIIRKGDSICINQQMFYLKKKGYCWDGEDKKGTYTMCVSDILSNFQLNKSLNFDTCYIFTKRYKKPNQGKYIHKLYLATENKLLVKYEICDQFGNVIGKEELISIVYGS